MRVGIIGSGRIGGNAGKLFARPSLLAAKPGEFIMADLLVFAGTA